MDLNLHGKRAFVGGSSKGLGLACARELALLGASVTLTGRDEERLEKALERLDTGQGQDHDFMVLNFNDPAWVKEKVLAYLSRVKTVPILINNTGGPPAADAYEAGPEQYLEAFSMQLVNFQMLVQAFVPGMKAERYGRIINITSTSVKEPIRGLGLSNTVRAAVANWAKSLADELGPYGITVNNVLPGPFDTERLALLTEEAATRQGEDPKELARKRAGSIPVRRIGMPEELGAAVAFLSSPAAAYINGVNLPVDGGQLRGL